MHDIAKPVKTQMKSKLRTMGVAVGSLIALIVIIVGIKGLQIGKMMSTPMVMPPTTVSSATVKAEDWAPTLSAVGSISAVQGAVVSSELGGVVSKIAFENGGTAKRSEEHTSELQSPYDLVCRLLLEKKNIRSKY